MCDASVITVGFSPAWDITCRADGLDWGQHVKVSQTTVPAGKALNVSKALAWMGQTSIAAGLWGRNDWPAAEELPAELKSLIDFRLTFVPGRTRQNITVIDTRRQREMHLRAPCRLATRAALTQLGEDLKALVGGHCCVVFSGSMPDGELLDDCLSIINDVCGSGASVAVDSSGLALCSVVQRGGLYVVKPNLDELSELLGHPVQNEVSAIIAAARTLCDRVEIVLVSRGADGAMVVTRGKAFACRVKTAGNKVVNTVACGDYLLAGFLAGADTIDLRVRLENAVKVATARAWGLTETMDRPSAEMKIDVETTIF